MYNTVYAHRHLQSFFWQSERMLIFPFYKNDCFYQLSFSQRTITQTQGWNFGRFLVLLGFRRVYSLSGKYSPSIPFPIEPEVPGTQSTRLRPQFHTESPIGKPMA